MDDVGQLYKPKVVYFYDPNLPNHYYGNNHWMKPHRLRMVHNLIMKYELYKHLDIRTPHPITIQDLTMTTEAITEFHDKEYIECLRKIKNKDKLASKEIVKYGISKAGIDKDCQSLECPLFEGILDFSMSSVGGSIQGAELLGKKEADIVINWGGGLHHAKKDKASGFCYINDIVLAILKLLHYWERVLYVDIDVHHGDGVEEAFETTNRVMTVSFHKFDKNYFPGTGDLNTKGNGEGDGYAVNVPLDDGIDDFEYTKLFKEIVGKVVEVFDPQAIVLQCGADSLIGDRLGTFNLTIKGHGECVRYIRSLRKPLLLLGGGGYTLANVAKCWCYETAVAVGVELPEDLPENDYADYFGNNKKLFSNDFKPNKNENSPEMIEEKKKTILKKLEELKKCDKAEGNKQTAG